MSILTKVLIVGFALLSYVFTKENSLIEIQYIYNKLVI